MLRCPADLTACRIEGSDTGCDVGLGFLCNAMAFCADSPSSPPIRDALPTWPSSSRAAAVDETTHSRHHPKQPPHRSTARRPSRPPVRFPCLPLPTRVVDEMLLCPRPSTETRSPSRAVPTSEGPIILGLLRADDTEPWSAPFDL